MEKQVVVYSTPTLGPCTVAKEFLSQAGIAFTAHDVSTDAAAQERLRQLPGRVPLPVITVDDAVVIGFQKAKLREMLGIT